MIASITSLLLLSYSTVLVLSIVKASFLGASTASRRGALKKFINEEDAAWLGGIHLEVDEPGVQRLFRAHRNELENLVLFLAAGGLYLLSAASAIAGVVYSVAF